MTRRFFLGIISTLLLLLSSPLKAVAKPLSDEDMLAAMLDALIPSDGTPGARDVDLHKAMLKMIDNDPEKARLYDAGFKSVRKELGASGGQVDWIGILKRIESTYFFRIMRRDAMRMFYSDPVSWKAIGYDGPPLIGYMDYHVCSKSAGGG